MFNINLKVLEWYWDNYTFQNLEFTLHKHSLIYNGKPFLKENIKDILISFYKNRYLVLVKS